MESTISRKNLTPTVVGLVGGILTVAYMKFRDLVANITAHFLGDFVLNVALPLVSGA
jgi:membrane protease YdiL (CAAX protease family)